MGNTFGGLKIVDDNEMNINNSMDVLEQWSNKNTYNILFDSDIDGDGNNNVLHKKVWKKSNLYFITFDANKNIFGGYVSVKIYKSNDWIKDDKSFVFSLIRDGNVKNTKYSIKSSKYAFCLWNNHQNWLYDFGRDFGVKRIGDNGSYCQYCYYNYNNEKIHLLTSLPTPSISKPNESLLLK